MSDVRPSRMIINYFLLLFLLSILLVGKIFWPFLSILVISYILTGIFKPVFKYMCRWVSPTFSSLLTCLLISVIVFLPLTFFVGALTQEAYSLYQWGKDADLVMKFRELQSSALVVKAQEALAGLGFNIEPEAVGKTLSDFAKTVGLFLYNQARGWAANIMQFLIDFLFMILVIFFLLADHEKLVNFLLEISPLPDDQERLLVAKFEEMAGAVLVGNGICGIIQGVLGGAMFAVFNIGPPVLWGGIMAILAFLPIFGIGLVLIPTAIILLIKGKTGLAVFVAVFYMILSFSMEYAVKPKIVGEKVKMHTLLVFLSIMGGLSVFGFMGIIYGPLIVAVFMTLADIYKSNYYEYIARP